MSYIKDAQAYKAFEERARAEKERMRKLKQEIIENADFACNSDEFEAVKNFLKFTEDKGILGAMTEYYYDFAQERNKDMMGA